MSQDLHQAHPLPDKSDETALVEEVMIETEAASQEKAAKEGKTVAQNTFVHTIQQYSLMGVRYLQGILCRLSIKKGLIALACILSAYTILGVLSHETASKPNQHSQVFLSNETVNKRVLPDAIETQKLAAISASIMDLRRELAGSNAIKDLKKWLDKTEEHIDTHTSQQVNEVISKITQDYQTLNQSLSDIERLLVQVNEGLQPQVLTDPSLLPFTVLAVDVIQYAPVVNVVYANHTLALMKGMQLAGWQLEGANFQDQTAEFMDSHNRHVRVVSDIGMSEKEKSEK